jgi:site-specific DNA-methyltransferase (adenine-specific)
VPTDESLNGGTYAGSTKTNGVSGSMAGPLHNAIDKPFVQPSGRWPANCIHDGSDDVLAAFAVFGEKPGAVSNGRKGVDGACFGHYGSQEQKPGRADSGTAARFFMACPPDTLRFHYSGKANAKDRAGSKHPTIKPQSLCRYLARLITPPGGTVLDPFAGSGAILQAAVEEGFSAIGVEKEAEYVRDIKRRMKKVRAPEPQKKAA